MQPDIKAPHLTRSRWMDILWYWVIVALSVLFLVWGNRLTTQDNAFFAGQTRAETYYRAKVVEVGEMEHVVESYDGWTLEYNMVPLHVYLEEGAMAGETVFIKHEMEKNDGVVTYPYEKGDRIFVYFDFDETGEPVWYNAGFLREGHIMGMIGAFFLLLIAFGRMKGVNTVLSLIFTTCAIFLVMIPGIIKGYNIYLLTFIITSYVIVMTLGVVIGIRAKSVAASMGCIFGVGLAGVLAAVMQNAMKITGLLDEEAYLVLYINPEQPINLQGVIFAAIVVGAMGATMDVAMSIASSLDELLFHRPDLTNRELVASGLNIGRDIMGTMANTLVLAYVGSSLQVILLLLAYNRSVSDIINRELIAVEVLQSVAGSIGILFTVPATTLATVALRRFFSGRAAAPPAQALAPVSEGQTGGEEAEGE